MPAWQDYTGQVDALLGALTPQQRAVVEAYTRNDSSSRDNTQQAQRNFDIAKAELVGAGYTEDQANLLLHAARNVRGYGQQDPSNGAFAAQGYQNFSQDDMARLQAMFANSGSGGDDGRAGISAQIQAFIDQLMGPINPNDPTAQVIRRNAVNAAQAYGGRAGLNARSSLGQSAVGGLYTRGMQQYDMQRQQLAQQGLGLLSQRDLGLGQLQHGYAQMQQGRDEARWAAEQNKMQGTMGAIGGIAGTAIGSYFGMPQLGQVGSQLGGGLGGLMGPTSPSYSPMGQSRGLGGSSGINPYTGR